MEVLRSAREIAQMRKAGLLVWRSLKLAESMIEPGVTTRQIDAAIEGFFAEQEAQPLFKGVPGKVPFPAVTCISINEEVVHGIPGPRELRQGDVVSIDTGCKLHGWCGDAAATFAVGAISPEVQRLLDVTKQTLQVAIEEVARRAWWSEVAERMERYVKSQGFSVVESFVGHGIGREMHEEPQVPNFVNNHFRRNGDFRLVPGLVLAIEPMVNIGTKRVRTMPDHWTQVTADGKPSAHFEHTVALTESGPYVLTAPPEEDKRMAALLAKGAAH